MRAFHAIDGNISFKHRFSVSYDFDVDLSIWIDGLGRNVQTRANGRCAIVLPDGCITGDGYKERIREKLLTDCNLHTIVRLPNGVFAPYTGIPTNLLFFDRTGPTKNVWFYEQPLPEGRKNYTKTQPMQFEDLKGCMAWWKVREENDQAWRVPVAELLGANCNLDRKNPRAKEDITHYLIDPGKPAQNGTVERSHREDQEKFYDQHKFRNILHLQRLLKEWNTEYNNLEHCGLSGRSPNEFLADYLKANPPNVCT